MVALPVLYLSRNHSEGIEIRKLFAVFAPLMHVAFARNCPGEDVSVLLNHFGPIVVNQMTAHLVLRCYCIDIRLQYRCEWIKSPQSDCDT